MICLATLLRRIGLAALLVSGSFAFAVPTMQEGVRRIANVPYGEDPRQRMDVYLPEQAAGAANVPVIVMVHGGAWMAGNKAMPKVVDNKVAYWVKQKGWIFVSVGYRLSPQVDPLVQARDVAGGLARAQSMAASWGGNPAKFVLMGHSAGAHLVALLSASPSLAREAGAQAWLGTVALDSAALDLERIMQARHMRFYDRVFGADPAYWRSVSPSSVLASDAVPMLLVCSTQRGDGPCPQARDFAAKVTGKGGRASVLPQNMTHEQINTLLGLPGVYTEAVEGFLSGLPLR
ncbi:alpha/beta hydrolase [Polaromonas sp. A23]|uniref:alpha/beta hydrolase n=1 Tax=Polaromonas sp. A23 TaxID=1944133 RepID=UPI000984E8C3|nr:alpha/beta hydrolase [Polaromonas sp. A23]OOG39767.1 esterase [Polaromonas sp. A23]